MAALPGDLLAGIMLAAIAVPEQLATARLAGFPPQAGLYAFVAATLAYAVFGANPYISVGADSTIAPIFAGSLATMAGASSVQYAPAASFLAIAVGAVLIVTGVARAGWIADLLSEPVTVGFLAGIAVHIVIGQLPALLGLPEGDGSLLGRLWQLMLQAGHANVFDLATGAVVFAITLLCARINSRIPGALLGMIAAGVLVSAFGLERHGVRMLGALSPALPALRVPEIPSYGDAAAIFPLTLVVAAVVMMQTAAVGRAFPAKSAESEDSSGDYLAVGVGNVVAGCFGTFAVNSSPPRTAIVKAAGAASQLAGLIAVVAVVAVILFAARLLAYVPQAALAGVLVYVATHLFRTRDVLRIAKYSPRELWLSIAASLFVVLLPIQMGMLLAIMLSLAHGVRLMMWPPATELVNIPGTTTWWPASDVPDGKRIPGIVVFAPAAPINFTNAQYLRERLLALIAQQPSPVRLVVIEASAVSDFDYTGSQSMQRTVRELRSRGIDVAVARLIVTHAQEAARRSGVYATIGEDHFFKSVHEAVTALGGVSAR